MTSDRREHLRVLIANERADRLGGSRRSWASRGGEVIGWRQRLVVNWLVRAR
jgi:hypothetical protein